MVGTIVADKRIDDLICNKSRISGPMAYRAQAAFGREEWVRVPPCRRRRTMAADRIRVPRTTWSDLIPCSVTLPLEQVVVELMQSIVWPVS